MQIVINHLIKEYRQNGRPLRAVDDLSFSVEKGEFVCVMGHSGCGKSTLLNMMTGMLRPTEGQVLLDGEDLCAKTSRQLADLRSTRIGYIPQGQGLLKNLTVWKNVCLPAGLARHKQDVSRRAEALLEQVGLSDRRDAYPASLSGGEGRRAAIARAMINSPGIVVADEPTCNLDPAHSRRIMELFRGISRQGVTVIVSTHNIAFLDYADRVLNMRGGRLVPAQQEN